MSANARRFNHDGKQRRRNQQPGWLIGCWLLLYSLGSYAQLPTRAQLTGTWLGVHIEWNADFFCALPTYLQLDANSTYHLGMVDRSTSEITSTWSVQDTYVRFDTIQYDARHIWLQNDVLRIGTDRPMVFRRLSVIPLDSAQTLRQLTGRVWESDSLRLSLFTDGRVTLENRLTKQRTAHFWRLAQLNSSIFLIIWGNAYNRDSGYLPTWQVRAASANQMQLIGEQDRQLATRTFRLVRPLTVDDTCQPSGFQPCSNCFQPHWPSHALYQPDKRYELKRLVETHYQSVDAIGQSGLLTIQFVMNCAGQLGPMDVKGFSDDYCPKVFTNQVVNQFITICRDHLAKRDLLFSRQELASGAYDAVVSLTFRLKDGQLTDILP